MHISDFDYELPAELIAQRALAERDASRMLVVDRRSQEWCDSVFTTFPDHLNRGDVVVLNNIRVFPARLRARRAPTGGEIELLLIREVAPNTWEALARPARRLKNGARLVFDSSQLRAEVIESLANGLRLIKFESEAPLENLLDQIGEPPLPPYIKRTSGIRPEDKERYQTVYASQRGAIAAPTAGLHFTPSVLNAIKARGAQVVEITLHVGYGTFEPVQVDDVSEHRVAGEWFSVTDSAAKKINEARAHGSRIIAVGTTSARALESAGAPTGELIPRSGFATLTIVPGYEFRVVNSLLTNFHLPRSSLLVLVSAFAGCELTLKAYRHAVEELYRFYSYGDCMLII